MSSEAKKLESMDHIFYTVKGILKSLDELKVERNGMLSGVMIACATLIEKEKYELPSIANILSAILACPTRSNSKFIRLSKELVNIKVLKKMKLNDVELDDETIQEWVCELFEIINQVNIEYWERVFKYVDQLMTLLGEIKERMQLADLYDNENRPKKEKTQKEHNLFPAKKTKGIGGN